MQIIAVQVVQPQKIRVVLLCPGEKLFGSSLAAESVAVGDPGIDAVKADTQISTDPNGVGLAGIRNEAIPAIGDFTV